MTIESNKNIIRKKSKMEGLEFVPLKIPRLIPVELIESVKGSTFTPKQFIDYQEKQVDNPGNFLYALIDGNKKIHGYLWAEQNSLDGSLFINTLSVSKEYWGRGEAITKAIKFLEVLRKQINANKVFWCTTNEKFFVKHGFVRSKISLMEYNENQQATDK